ncbi:hypothetical protein K505DRAFT_415225 [Melanomma pulvis-pyrius CBS 109.77]|uniref:Uncharacterized protein n=1 Tax=Melanomma pulvis-pyrius CBS 109.77 TaxID=1314802 RepID=A0A6A6XM47_9PLEO|nr:hypothetical protein K505DRAFT_415225 [Melanomma pulvis-pyrius CBS 109.77]
MDQNAGPALLSGIQDARARLFRAIKEQHAFNEQIKHADIESSQLDTGTTELKNENEAVRKSRDSHERQAAEAAASYGQALCLPFARKFHRTLPREIRDLVYQHHWSGNPCRAVGKRCMSEVTTATSRSCPCFIFVNPDFVSLEIAREAMESFYAVGSETITHAYFDISKFLNTDQLGLGIIRANSIRNVELDVPVDLRTSPCTDPSVSMRPVDDRVFHGTLGDNLDAFRMVKKKAAFSLDVHINGANMTCWELTETMDIVRPIFQHLTQQGSRVRVRVSVWDWHKTLELELTRYYAIDRALWIARLKEDMLKATMGDPFRARIRFKHIDN